MARSRGTQTNGQSGKATARRRRVAGAASAVGAFLAFGMTPLAGAPLARADEFDWLVNLFDPALSSLSGVDATADASALALPGAADAASGAIGSTPFDAWFDQYLYLPLHADLEAWINSPLGAQVDGVINSLAGQYLIGNGTAGTAADPDGGNAGLLFGDGGAGYGYSGNGGDAGLLFGPSWVIWLSALSSWAGGR